MSIRALLKKGLTATLVGLLLLLGTVTALAAETYPTYSVKSGDTLWIVANKFYTSTSKLYAANDLKSETLSVGQKLIIPQTKSYQVSTGDTPYLIAKRFKVSLNEFLSVNNITDVNSLYPGQELKIPGIMAYQVWSGDTLFLLSKQFGVTTDRLISLNKLQSSALKPGYRLYIPFNNTTKQYTVQPGDTLYLISLRFSTSVDLLTKANGLKSTYLEVGQVLTIPEGTESSAKVQPTPNLQTPGTKDIQAPQWNVPSQATIYYVQLKDNLWSIAQKFNTTMDAIKTTNNLKMDLVFPGDPLIIPRNTSQPIYGIKAPSVTAKSGFGELLDWEFARWIFNAGSTATIEDLQTGQKFQAYRIGGSNHADCEPLTTKDTSIMKGLFGNNWTWISRPVLVHHNGRTLAASMAGQPHAWDTIPNNNFNGMFDLHFLNSRTHNTNSIDPSHQASVQKAAGN